MLNQRLKQIADYVLDNSFVLDVGCDHALLDIYLVKNKKNVCAIASDISENALEYAKRNIEKYDAFSVKIALGSGLETITKDVDIVVISGMGALTMINILKEGNDKIKQVKRFILSPNVDVELLRKYMVENDFYIVNESLVFENKKYYTIIVFEQGKKEYTEEEIYFGPCLLKEKNDVFLKKINEEKMKITDILNDIKEEKNKKELKEKLKYYESIL